MQVLLELHELFPAIQAAEKAVSLNPQWFVAHQTLGRAQMGFGDPEMVITAEIFLQNIFVNQNSPHDKITEVLFEKIIMGTSATVYTKPYEGYKPGVTVARFGQGCAAMLGPSGFSLSLFIYQTTVQFCCCHPIHTRP